MGDLLRRLESENSHNFPDKEVNLLLVSRECILLVLYGRDNLVTFTTSGRELSCLRCFLCIFFQLLFSTVYVRLIYVREQR